jgi:hypothetical protein
MQRRYEIKLAPRVGHGWGRRDRGEFSEQHTERLQSAVAIKAALETISLHRWTSIKRRQIDRDRLIRQIEHCQHALSLIVSNETNKRRWQGERLQRSMDQRRFPSPPMQEPSERMQHRGFIGFLRIGCHRAMRFGHRQPGCLRGRETTMCRTRTPGHRCPAAVATAELWPVRNPERIAQIVFIQHRFRQPELFPLIQADTAT